MLATALQWLEIVLYQSMIQIRRSLILIIIVEKQKEYDLQMGKIAAPTTFPAQQVVITHAVHPQRSQWALRTRFARQRAENKCFFAIPIINK